MVKRKLNKNQTKFGIKTLDWNVPANHISRFVVEFVEEVFPLLNIILLNIYYLYSRIFEYNFV